MNIVNGLKHKLFWTAHMLELKCQRRLRQRKYSKYLILWHGRIQFFKKNLRRNDQLFIIASLGGVGVQVSYDGMSLAEEIDGGDFANPQTWSRY